MAALNSEMRATTLAEVLVTMIFSGLLLLAVYDGLNILSRGVKKLDDVDYYGSLDWLENYEILEFRSDSVRKNGKVNVFYVNGEPVDTLVNYGF